MLTYVNKPVLLLWKGVGERDGVGLIKFLAMLFFFFSVSRRIFRRGTNQLLLAARLEWEREAEKPVPSFLLSFFSVFWVARCPCPPTAPWQLPFDKLRKHASHFLCVALFF